jgi:very-short-patch-repair endonuclease
MGNVDRLASALAVPSGGFVLRPSLLDAGGTDAEIHRRTGDQAWQRLHPGLYLPGSVQLDWAGRLHAATLAAGSGAVSSRRAAWLVWELDGLASAPLELTVPYTHGPVPAGVIVHRTRRPIHATVRRGIPVTTVEQTLLDGAGCLPAWIVEKGVESALRRGLTSHGALVDFVERNGGRGVRGVRWFTSWLEERGDVEAARSGAETELLRGLRDAGIEAPVRQHRVPLLDGSVATVDIAWPWRRKGIEVDGLDTHASPDALDYDLERQNQLWDVGFELRRFSGRRVRRQLPKVVSAVQRFLANDPTNSVRIPFG